MDYKNFIVGIYGPAGSGKSYAAGCMVRLANGLLIDGDELCHEVLNKVLVQQKLAQYFGDSIVDNGSINRRKLGEKVFQDTSSLEYLESIVWPEIEKIITCRICSNQQKMIVIDAAVLIKAGWDKYCDLTLYMDCEKEKRRKNLLKKGIKEKRAQLLLDAQNDFELQRHHADIILSNNKSLEDLDQQIRKLILSWTQDKTRLKKAEQRCQQKEAM